MEDMPEQKFAWNSGCAVDDDDAWLKLMNRFMNSTMSAEELMVMRDLLVASEDCTTESGQELCCSNAQEKIA